jgi:HD superfamily phosphohydrolase
MQKSEWKDLCYKERQVQNCENIHRAVFFSSSKVLLVDASVYADIQWMRAIFRLKRKENSSQILGNVNNINILFYSTKVLLAKMRAFLSL